ncbi:MAG: hypothetical protein LBU34_17820 [Planctomycetaceae bacterium]|jgi:hypothetical protein|nr:hypothetical protein [Planctomycetaceae bacterium]
MVALKSRKGRNVHNRRWSAAQPTDACQHKVGNRSPKGFHPPPQCRGEKCFAPIVDTTVGDSPSAK